MTKELARIDFEDWLSSLPKWIYQNGNMVVQKKKSLVYF